MNGLDPRFNAAVNYLLAAARRSGVTATIVSGYRSPTRQAALYAACAHGCKYPVAPPGRSMHERRVAVDLGGVSPANLRRMGVFWERMGGTWGGRFGDPIHFDARRLLR